ncbi:MAG: hypothetical protein F6K41_00420 [Symploca sp. SIO3E6]|nr:hypothetical protein [Caldora sp. SIO3E6]
MALNRIWYNTITIVGFAIAIGSLLYSTLLQFNKMSLWRSNTGFIWMSVTNPVQWLMEISQVEGENK